MGILLCGIKILLLEDLFVQEIDVDRRGLRSKEVSRGNEEILDFPVFFIIIILNDVLN